MLNNISIKLIFFIFLDFMFPGGTKQEDMKICDVKVKAFCKDGVEKCEIMFILSTVSCLLVVLSLVSGKNNLRMIES